MNKRINHNSPSETVVVCNLGVVPYEPAWRLQQNIQAELIRAKRADPPEHIPHVLLAVEHPPVYTLGKSGNLQNLLISEALLKQRGATFVHIDRGGDITFHGPGQLVGYPILDLGRLSPDIGRYLRNLEEAGIRTCEAYGLSAGRVEGKTGVWIDSENSLTARKICAMGIRCSRWVSMHGFALNVSTDLSYFDHIVPCGLTNAAVTSLSKEAGRQIEISEVLPLWIQHFSDVFSVQAQMLNRQQSLEFLKKYLKEPLSAYELEAVDL